MAQPTLTNKDLLTRHDGLWKDWGDTKDSKHPYKTEFDPMATTFLPYGVWTFEDGTEVLFTRAYMGIWVRNDPDVWMMPKLMHHSDFIGSPRISEEYFRDDFHHNPKRDPAAVTRCRAIVGAFISMGEIGHFIID